MVKIILEDWQVKNLREYFGHNDKTQTAHWAYEVFNKAYKEQCTIPLVVKSLPSAIILAEKFAESKREHVVKCRIEKGSIANLGLYLGFIEGYNYVIEELKRGNVL